jgi:hypothetical protein
MMLHEATFRNSQQQGGLTKLQEDKLKPPQPHSSET